MFSSEADIFFRKASERPIIPGTFGVLYLLRRDTLQCLGFDPNTGARNKEPVLWPGGMAILAGIDLTAKFFKGDDNIGGVGQRFKDFIEQNFQHISAGDKETIYQLRNSLLHSFGLYSKTKTQTYHFILTANNSPLVQQTGSDEYKIDLLSLHQQFENAIEKYATDLNTDSTLQSKFSLMFPNYGSIHIG